MVCLPYLCEPNVVSDELNGTLKLSVLKFCSNFFFLVCDLELTLPNFATRYAALICIRSGVVTLL